MIIKVTIPTITTISSVTGCNHSGNRYTNDFTTISLDIEGIDINIIECEDCYCQEPDLLTQLQNTSNEEMQDVFDARYSKIQSLLKSKDYDQIQDLKPLDIDFKPFVKKSNYEATIHIKHLKNLYIASYYDDDIMCCSAGSYKHEIPMDLLLCHPDELKNYRYDRVYTLKL